MEKLKGYVDEMKDFQVIDAIKAEIKDKFPDTPESSPDKYSHHSEEDSDEGKKGKRKEDDKTGLFSGVKNFFKITKKEQKEKI